MIEIDGSMGEGGGQILRTAIAISALTGIKVKIFNIRAKRKPPGLKTQHLYGVKAMAEISDAEVEGLRIGSTEITFKPRRVLSGDLKVEIPTAGSIPLIIQAIMPPLAFASEKTKVEITGGTDVKWSPLIDYMRFVFIPHVRKMGYNVEIKLIRRGHYPRGGGRIILYAIPVEKLKPLVENERGYVKRIRGISHCVKLPRHVSERQAKAAEKYLRKYGFTDIIIDQEWYPPEKDPHLGPGSGIVLWTETSKRAIIGADELGEKGKRAEIVGGNAAKKLIEEIECDAPVDRHLSDMLPIYMALADGYSEIVTTGVTSHTDTIIQLLEKMLDIKFHKEMDSRGRGIISVKGLGFKNKHL